MSLIEITLMAVSLSMDAFAVAVCKGLALCKIKLKNCLWVGLWFGAFQALMPAMGYLCAVRFEKYVHAFSHWIAFVLLGIIGVNMMREAKAGEVEELNSSFGPGSMLPLAVATSIDAFAVGLSFACMGMNTIASVLPAIIVIGVVSFLFSLGGYWLGICAGKKINFPVEIVGGVILLFIGSKILIEHLSA